MSKSLFKERLEKLRNEIGSATLVAVSKYSEASDIATYCELGHFDFGENRVDDLIEKSQSQELEAFPIRWHFIGHLQSNKVAKLLTVKGLTTIQSVDSLKLLEKIVTSSDRLEGREVELHLEVKTSFEESKQGFDSAETVKEALAYFKENAPKNLKITGLMTMAPIRVDDQRQAAIDSFSKLKQIRDQVDPSLKLNMGMSGDYKEACELGSNMVRVGSYLFK